MSRRVKIVVAAVLLARRPLHVTRPQVTVIRTTGSNSGYWRTGTHYSNANAYQPGYYNQAPRRGPNGDYDRDGVPNRYDRDANGDGVPDRYQR